MKCYFILIALYSTTLCNSQIVNKGRPNIDSAAEEFDKSVFINKRSIRIDGNDTIYINSDSFRYVESDKNHRELKQFSRGSNSNGEVGGYDYSVNPLFGVYKAFHSNGMIKEKGLFCWFGFKMGIWYYYNNEGSLISTTDYDKGYNFGQTDLFEFCAKNSIPLIRNDSSSATKLLKADVKGKKYWIIEYNSYSLGKVKFIELNAATGEVIREFETQFPEER